MKPNNRRTALLLAALSGLAVGCRNSETSATGGDVTGQAPDDVYDPGGFVGYDAAGGEGDLSEPADVPTPNADVLDVGSDTGVDPTPDSGPSADGEQGDVEEGADTHGPSTGEVVVNEVVAAAANGGDDWIELYALATVDLSGWILSDDGDHTYVLPEGTTLAAGDYLVVGQGAFAFGLGAADAVRLAAPGGDVVDAVIWEASDAPAGSSFGRLPNGVGAFQTLATPTPGQPNTNDAPVPCGDGVCAQDEDCASCLLDCGACATGCAPDLFFSRYLEGVGAERALALRNLTGDSVDLGHYAVARLTDGGTWGAASVTPLTGTLAHGQAWVLCHPSVQAPDCDVISADAPLTFNGDDALALLHDGTRIDVIGQEGPAPVEGGFAVLGIAAATRDHQLVRKATVRGGSLDWALAASSEWLVVPPEVVGELGPEAQAPGCEVSAEPAVVLNELVHKAVGGGDDWFELYNPSGGALALSGWAVSDDAANSYTFTDEDAALVPAFGYLVVTQTTFTFGLGKDDALTLTRPDGTVQDSADWQDGDAPEGASYGRQPNGTGPFTTLETPSPGAPN